jgi:SNF2 family DNA or RNA helicase
LFSKQGTGKTYIAMAVLEALRPQLVLIVAPLTALDITWKTRLTTLAGMPVLEPSELVRRLKMRSGVDYPVIVLTNPEALRNAKLSKRLAKLPWSIVVWDESQSIKDRNSLNSRTARKFRFAKRRLALSGTPIDTSQIDVWAQMRFVDCEVFGDRWQDFANEYCYRSGWMGKEWKFSKHMNDQFLHKLKNHIFRLNKEFLNLKPLTIIPVPVEMFGRQEEIYKSMETDNIVQLNGVDIAARLMTTIDVKLSQITGGCVLDDDGRAHRTGFAKERKLKHLISKLEPPFVIFCQYLHEIVPIADILRRSKHLVVGILRGSVKGDERTSLINDFQAGKIDAIVCQLRTGGVSIDLTASNTLIFYSMNYSYIDFDQIIHRLHRGGQERDVTAYILFCNNTIDEDKLEIVKTKSEVSTSILSHFEGSK